VAELGGIGQTLLVDFGVEGLTFALFDFEFALKVLLLSVHLGLVLQSVLVQHFILTLACSESLLIALIVVQFFQNARTRVGRTHCLVLHRNAVDFALFNQLKVLTIADFPLLTSLKLLPSFHFHHGGIGVQVLALEFDFLQLLGKAFFLITFLFLLLVNVTECFEQSLLSGCLVDGLLPLNFVLLVLTPLIGLILSLLPSDLNLVGVLHQLL